MKRSIFLFVIVAELVFGPVCAFHVSAQQAGRPRRVDTKPLEPCNERDFIQAADTHITSLCQNEHWKDVATGTAGITNSAGVGVLPKSDGTNLVTSGASEAANVFSVTESSAVNLNAPLVKVENSADSALNLTVKNTNAGSSASASVNAQADSGTFTLGNYSNAHAPYGAIAAGDGYIYKSGTNIALMADTGGTIKFASGGATLRWKFDASGHFITGADNTYDIGASGATRPRTGYFGTSVISPVLAFSNTSKLESATTGAKFTIGGDAYLSFDDSSTGLSLHRNWGLNWGGTTAGSATEVGMKPGATGVIDITGRFSFAQGTITTSAPYTSQSATWNNGGTVFTNFISNVTNTASAAGSKLFTFQIGGNDSITGLKDGSIRAYLDATNYIFMGNNGTHFTFGTNANRNIIISTNSTDRWYFSDTGHFISATDNIYDIGASGASRPRTGYFGTSVVVPATSLSSATVPITFTNAAFQGCTSLGTSAGGVVNCTVSTERQKENLNPFANGLAAVRKIHPQTFSYIKSSPQYKNGRNELGLIAEDLQKANPLLVSKTGAGVLQPEPMAIAAIQIAAMKELDARVTALEKENRRLKARLYRRRLPR